MRPWCACWIVSHQRARDAAQVGDRQARCSSSWPRWSLPYTMRWTRPSIAAVSGVLAACATPPRPRRRWPGSRSRGVCGGMPGVAEVALDQSRCGLPCSWHFTQKYSSRPSPWCMCMKSMIALVQAGRARDAHALGDVGEDRVARHLAAAARRAGWPRPDQVLDEVLRLQRLAEVVVVGADPHRAGRWRRSRWRRSRPCWPSPGCAARCRRALGDLAQERVGQVLELDERPERDVAQEALEGGQEADRDRGGGQAGGAGGDPADGERRTQLADRRLTPGQVGQDQVAERRGGAADRAGREHAALAEPTAAARIAQHQRRAHALQRQHRDDAGIERSEAAQDESRDQRGPHRGADVDRGGGAHHEERRGQRHRRHLGQEERGRRQRGQRELEPEQRGLHPEQPALVRPAEPRGVKERDQEQRGGVGGRGAPAGRLLLARAGQRARGRCLSPGHGDAVRHGLVAGAPEEERHSHRHR